MNGHKKIDIVVPIYKGQHYIRGIVSQIESCASKVSEGTEVGLILVNDAPSDNFCETYRSNKIEILMVETERNRGIHGARVRGLSYCKGDYVIFLDQDDKIFPDYLKSQLEVLGNAEAVICRAINGEREFYGQDKPFEKLTSEQYMFSIGNGILSPGQVLICRKAIPQFWRENILQYSGADDWMLWLCMLQEGCHFVCNQEILYEHVLNNGNCSGSTFGMYQSEKNMYEIIEENGYFSRQHLELLRQAIYHGMDVRLKELDRLKWAVNLYDMWLAIHARGQSIRMYLKSANCYKVAIYGMSKIGLQLYQEIREDIDVDCFIDRDAAVLKADIPVHILEETILQADLIIISIFDKDGRIIEKVSSMFSIPVKGIEEILLDIFAEE